MIILPKKTIDSMSSESNYQWCFYRTRSKNLKIFIETLKTPNSQSNLEGKKTQLEESDSLTSVYSTKLQ